MAQLALSIAASAIVTHNVKDFDHAALLACDLSVVTPDEVLCWLLWEDRSATCASLRVQRTRRKRPQPTPDEFLALLAARGFTAAVAALRSSDV